MAEQSTLRHADDHDKPSSGVTRVSSQSLTGM
jgi:hypothetical protein